MSAVEIATKVLAKAAIFDPRIQVTRETIIAWSECFGSHQVWPREALNAVTEHYSKSNPFPLMPGDIIEFCKAQPIWSSNEHARHFLVKWADHPMSTAIADQTGIQPPQPHIPDGLLWPEEKQLRIEALKKWIVDNEGPLVGAILSRQYNAPELEQ